MSRYASPGTVSFMARSDHHRVETSWDMGASGAAGGSTIGGVGCAAGANG